MKTIFKRIFPILIMIALVISVMPLHAFATTVNVLDGKISITDTKNKATVQSDGSVKITANGGLLSGTTNTITVTNTSGATAKISFDYTVSGHSSHSFESNSGSYSKTFAAGEGVTFTVSASNLKTATLKLSNFSVAEATSKVNVTFKYDSNFGSVAIDGATISTNSTVEIDPSTGASFVATPVKGASFVGWIDTSDNTILSHNASYSFTAIEDMTVNALFTNSASIPYFMVEGKYLVDDLNVALNKAATSSSSKTVVLMNNATLPAGNYTIPSGVTLLIPFDSANTLYTTEPGHDEGKTNYVPTPYRTLNMASGANIIVNGAISLSAKHREAQGSGYGCENSGAYGCINMSSGSNIIVNNGASLYAWGYIIGDGSVVANSGATVYEYFQFRDFRGGSISLDMTEKTAQEYGVFLFSQYYVQNIEVPLTIYAGAIEKTYTSLTIASQDLGEDITFIGSSDAMFTISEGYVTKKYDGSTDRLIIEANGTFSVAPITIKIGNFATDLIGKSMNIDTSKYELPITNNLTVIANSGNVTLNQDLALLPGSEIIVRKDATCTLGSGVNIYAYDADEWGTYIYGKMGSVSGVHKFLPLNYAPSRTYTRTEADLVDAKIQVDGIVDASAGYVYTTAGGANIFSTGNGKVITVPGTQTATYQFVQGSNYTAESNIAIPITPAKAKNADGSFTETSTATTATTYIYNATHGKWDNNNHTITEEPTAPTCTENGCITYTCTCGYSYVADGDPATGHSLDGEWIIEAVPTYSADGCKYHICEVCREKGDVTIIPKHTVPDINSDGILSAADLVRLKKIVLGIDLVKTDVDNDIYETIMDLNDDGKYNIMDLIRLKRIMLAL